jgi:branched-chain amino acid transport system substrate-binding protein
MVAGAAIAALLALSAACGSDSSDGNNDTSEAPSASGTPADPSKPAVKIGFHNLEGGSISLPDVRLGFEAGLKYVNEELGGVNGHKLEASYCKTDGTPESSVNCGNKFVSDKAVLSVQGADFGTDAMLPVLKTGDVVEFGSFALTPGANAQIGDAYMTYFAAEEGYAASVVQQKENGAKKVAVAMVDNAASRASYDKIIEPAGKKIGVTTKAFYFPAGTDWAVLSATILSWGADAVTLYAASEALPAVQAFRSAGFDGYIDVGSNTDIIPQLDESMLEKVTFNSPVYPPSASEFPEGVKDDIATFNRFTKSLQKDGNESRLQSGFYTAVMTADALRQIAETNDSLTAKVVHDGMATIKGDRQIFRTVGYDCSTPTWPNTTACGTGSLYFTGNKDGKLEPLPNQPVDISAVLP